MDAEHGAAYDCLEMYHLRKLLTYLLKLLICQQLRHGCFPAMLMWSAMMMSVFITPKDLLIVCIYLHN